MEAGNIDRIEAENDDANENKVKQFQGRGRNEANTKFSKRSCSTIRRRSNLLHSGRSFQEKRTQLKADGEQLPKHAWTEPAENDLKCGQDEQRETTPIAKDCERKIQHGRYDATVDIHTEGNAIVQDCKRQLQNDGEDVISNVRMEFAEEAVAAVEDMRTEGRSIVEGFTKELQEVCVRLGGQAKYFLDTLVAFGRSPFGSSRVGNADSVNPTNRDPGYEGSGVSGNSLRILCVGRTGDGKSSTANSLLGQDLFKVSAGSSSMTKKGKRECSSIHGHNIEVVDTPGFFDTDLTEPEVNLELQRSLLLTAPGFHAICVVVKKGRFTEELKKTIDLVFDFFGPGVELFALVIFTDINNQKELLQFLEIEEATTSQSNENCQTDKFSFAVDAKLKGYMNKHEHNINPNLRNLIKRCKGNIAIINNKAESYQKVRQSRAILQCIQNIKIKNKDKCFSNEHFEAIETIVKTAASNECKHENERQETDCVELQEEQLREEMKNCASTNDSFVDTIWQLICSAYERVTGMLTRLKPNNKVYFSGETSVEKNNDTDFSFFCVGNEDIQ